MPPIQMDTEVNYPMNRVHNKIIYSGIRIILEEVFLASISLEPFLSSFLDITFPCLIGLFKPLTFKEAIFMLLHSGICLDKKRKITVVAPN